MITLPLYHFMITSPLHWHCIMITSPSHHDHLTSPRPRAWRPGWRASGRGTCTTTCCGRSPPGPGGSCTTNWSQSSVNISSTQTLAPDGVHVVKVSRQVSRPGWYDHPFLGTPLLSWARTDEQTNNNQTSHFHLSDSWVHVDQLQSSYLFYFCCCLSLTQYVLEFAYSSNFKYCPS